MQAWEQGREGSPHVGRKRGCLNPRYDISMPALGLCSWAGLREVGGLGGAYDGSMTGRHPFVGSMAGRPACSCGTTR